MNIDITQAQKDELYRQSLSTEGYTLPEKPVREIELTDADLKAVYGGMGSKDPKKAKKPKK